MRVVLKGIHKVNSRLATGEIKTYYYAWRGEPQIKAKPGTPEFITAYHEAHIKLRQPRAGTLMTVIAEYNRSRIYPAGPVQPASLPTYTSS